MAGLTVVLRDRVRSLHREAERSGVLNDLLRGRASARGYAMLLRNLLPAYQAMEVALQQNRESALLSEMARPELYRAHSLSTDLADMCVGLRLDLPLLPEGVAYASRVTQAASGDGRCLIAHAYTRYLGDLSGGVVLERLLTRVMPSAPLRFHRFQDIADPKAYKMEFRAAIDRAGTRLADWSAVVEEAAAAFQSNIALSRAVKKAIDRTR